MGINVYDIAGELVNFTHRSIFLTGKAGTGKTTFLRNLKESTPKQIAVVAPTGVAAVNAGGTTIHSFFQIAPGTLIPTEASNYQFLAKQQVNAVRRKVFAALELLVIDEISMVRADLIDIIDVILRHYRYRHREPFGGVQVMLIGDMHQLPPVCNNDDWQILKEYYASPYFFHSRVMQELKPVYVEFDKIFRQTNMQFVNLLNNVRNNRLTQEDFDLLNKRYVPDFDPKDEDGYILLTTHNAKADVVNSTKLQAIEAESFYFDATVSGDFPDKNFPAEHRLHLKEGAKVMFIANDKQPLKRYYNGRIGVITHISQEEGIYVKCDGEEESIAVEMEMWNNVKYKHDKETNTISEEVSGTFTQYPLRLAWAITIHKSQGLTFDKAVVDAGHAFSSGQVYVALSRCTSLDGMVLTTRINPHSLSVDDNVVEYAMNKVDAEVLAKIAEDSKYEYTYGVLKDVFGFEDLRALVSDAVKYFMESKEDFGEVGEKYLDSFEGLVRDMYNVGQRFVRQLDGLFTEKSDKIQERVAAASDYFADKLSEMISLIEASPVVTDSKTQSEDYEDKMKMIYEMVSLRLWLIIGLKSDCSVSHYFAVKSTYKVPKLKISAYAGATERTRIKTDHPELYRMLARERNEICEELDMPVYFVATTKMLVAMANLLPQAYEDLARISGFGKERIKRFGEKFLGVIEQYCKENGIESAQRFDFGEEGDSEYIKKSKKKKTKVVDADVVDAGVEVSSGEEQKTKKKEQKEEKEPTLEVSLRMLMQYKDVERVAQERGLTEGTIWAHLTKLVKESKIDPEFFVEKEVIAKVTEYKNSHEGVTITAMYDYFNAEYSYYILRVSLATLQ